MRVFSSFFESLNDFNGFYITPPLTLGTNHALVTEKFFSGSKSHKSWITNPLPPTSDNHRAYPTVQLYKLLGGGFVTPVMTSIMVYIDTPPIPNGLWFSFLTISKIIDVAPTYAWDGVLANIGSVLDPLTKGCLHLMHVPSVGLKNWIYQNVSNPFPFRQWVKIEMLIDFSPINGYAKLWQDGILMSYALVSGGHSIYEQMHAGLYADKSLGSGIVYNDLLLITEMGLPNKPDGLQLKFL